MIKKIALYLTISVVAYLVICLITPFNKYLKKRSIENQITYIDHIFSKGYDDELQTKFPEGKLFSNAIFSLSILEFCEVNNCINETYAKIVDQNIKRILSHNTLSIFNSDMKPAYGIFYNGWSCYVLNTYRQHELFKLSSIKQDVEQQAILMEQRIIRTQQDSLRILDSYLESNWPADNLIGLISINNDSLQLKWLELILNATEHESGLIHHSGSQKSNIRGSSQALIIFCLGEMAYDNANEYNERFKINFVDEYIGVQMVKENEDGSNRMDVDSGPVIFGYGASATIMNIKTQAKLKERKSKNTWAVMNTISLPINLIGKKYYLFKKEPMFDIFMLWASVELN